MTLVKQRFGSLLLGRGPYYAGYDRYRHHNNGLRHRNPSRLEVASCGNDLGPHLLERDNTLFGLSIIGMETSRKQGQHHWQKTLK